MLIPNPYTRQSETGNPAYEWFIQSKIWKELTAQQSESDKGTNEKPNSDGGESTNQAMREYMLHFCSVDAAVGIRPVIGISCLNDKDYEVLNGFADHSAKVFGVSDRGCSKGENVLSSTNTHDPSREPTSNNTGGV